MSDFVSIHNNVVCFEVRDGLWYYRAVDNGWTQPMHGPYATVEEVAREAVASLGLRHGFLDGVERHPDIDRLVEAVNREIEEAIER